MVLVKNIALSYTLPQKFLKKVGASSASVYAQVLNPFLWGGELVKAGINPDDITGWDAGTILVVRLIIHVLQEVMCWD